MDMNCSPDNEYRREKKFPGFPITLSIKISQDMKAYTCFYVYGENRELGNVPKPLGGEAGPPFLDGEPPGTAGNFRTLYRSVFAGPLTAGLRDRSGPGGLRVREALVRVADGGGYTVRTPNLSGRSVRGAPLSDVPGRRAD